MAPYDLTNPHIAKFCRDLANPFKQMMFLMAKLPAAWFMRIRVDKVSPEKVEVSVPYGWRSKNPFNSIYFAAEAAAAEMSTGVFGLMAIQGRGSVAVLVLDIKGEFYKKATTRTVFTCTDGPMVFDAVTKTINTGEPQTVTCESVGVQQNGEVVAKFWITWTFKARLNKGTVKA